MAKKPKKRKPSTRKPRPVVDRDVSQDPYGVDADGDGDVEMPEAEKSGEPTREDAP